MKEYKTIDLFSQFILLALLGVAYFMDDSEKLSPVLIAVLFGAVQVISILVHLGAGFRAWKMKGPRKFHLIGTALVLAAILLAFLLDAFRHTGDKEDKYSMPGLGLLVYTMIPALLLALFYSLITLMEWIRMKKKV